MGLHLGSVVLLIFKCSHVCKTEMALGKYASGEYGSMGILIRLR